MACKFEVTLPSSNENGVALADAALDEVDRIEQQLSVFRVDSEVSKLNREAALAPVKVDQSLYQLLSLCKELHHDTEGAFDVTSGPLTRCWGFLMRQGRVPTPEQIEEAISSVGSEKLLLDPSGSVFFTRSDIEINFGSIGKGYALDRIASIFDSQKQSCLLNAAGSSFRAIGSDTWTVGLRDPTVKSRRLGVLRLRNCSMSTSGSEEQFFESEGRRYGHIIDPRTGWPSESVTSVTVVTDSAAVSDALATAFFVAGRQLAERYCKSHPEVAAILFERNETAPVVIGSHSRCSVEL